MKRYKRPDTKSALSLIESARNDMAYTLTLKVSEQSAPTIIRNIYECFRALGDALLIMKGIESIDHIEPVQELFKLEVETSRPIFLIENLRTLRRNIKYYGYKPSLAEVQDAISIAKTCFEPVYLAVLEKKKI
ncbi:MAG: hypothetical protein V1743_05315 [Nanoarchaeota archaeon]